MKKYLAASLALLLLMLLAAPAFAQGQLIYRDDLFALDRTRITNAATPLLNRGATVAIYNTRGGGDADFLTRLTQDGLARSDGTIRNELIAIYVSSNPNYSAIRYGDTWRSALDSTYTQIRNNQLNGGLRDGDYNAAFVNSLNQLENTIGTAASGGSGSGDGSGLLIIGGGALVAGASYFGYRAIKRRSDTAKVFASKKQGYEDARRQAGAAIADFATLLRDNQEKAQFDKVSYPAADVAKLAELQAQSEELFLSAQERFKAVDEGLVAIATPTEANYDHGAAAYAAITPQIDEARSLLEQAQARRAELDALNAQVPAAVDNAKKALADATERLNALGDEFSNPQAIIRPFEHMVARVESLQAEHRAADAITAAGAASAATSELGGVLDRFATLREGLSAGRAAAEQAASQGYKIEAGLAAFNTAEGVLRQAAATLERDGPAAAVSLLDQAEAARAEGAARGGSMPTLKAENEARLPQVGAAIEALNQRIEGGRQTFSRVAEFAESTWSDIRGNGSEAEASAGRAHQLWQQAGQRNTMETQDFLGAKGDLAAATELIERGEQLITAIVQRLADLEAARSAAKEEISLAEADIATGWKFVRANDPDVGKQPEQALQQAETLLEQARAEVGKPQPDWLVLVKQARAANQLADQALAGARSEVEVMNKLRAEVDRARQVATAEVQKIVQFVSVRQAELSNELANKLQGLQTAVQAAYTSYQRAEKLEESARLGQLRQTSTSYSNLHDQADALYQEIYTTFQRIDEMRGTVGQEVQQAEAAIADAERELARVQAYVRASADGGLGRLENARRLLGAIGPVNTEAQMQAALAAARQAREEARRAGDMFETTRREHERAQQQAQRDAVGDVARGVLIGQVLSGGSRHNHSWGGRRGGGGGGGGGGWGGGGGGGGGWGGGGGGGGGGW